MEKRGQDNNKYLFVKENLLLHVNFLKTSFTCTDVIKTLLQTLLVR